MSLGQQGTRGKGHEIAGIKALLETLTLKGCIVTIDAIGCQTEIAQKIVDQGGDYLLAVKDNQQSLAEALREFFNEGQCRGFGAMALSAYQTLGKDHGRIETRNHLWVSDLRWLDRPIRQHYWPKLAGVGMVERIREINGKASTERAFYIGSKGIANAETFAKAARSHWAVENGLHWVLDMTFREDECPGSQGACAAELVGLAQVRADSATQGSTVPQAQPAEPPQNRRAHAKLSRFIVWLEATGLNAIALRRATAPPAP